MKAVCPKDPYHKRFITVAHVSEDWEVDESGQFLRSKGVVEVVHKPRHENSWTCAVCGEEAKVEP